MDLPTIANFAEAFAVIVAVVFGMVQLRQPNAQRRREAAFALMHSIQSPQMLLGILIINRLQNAPAKTGIDALPENDQVDVTALYSGTLQQSWRKLQRYAEELRKSEDFFDEVPPEKPAKEMVDLAVQLITQKSAPYRPEKFEDHYQTALKELVQEKLKGHKIIAAPEEPRIKGGNVVDLMAALRASIEGKKPAKAKPSKSPRKSA